jgi:nitrogen fixation NifU-like protein
LAKGKCLEEAAAITDEEVSFALGGLPDPKMHCSNIGVSALRTAIKNYYSIKRGDKNENCNTSK